MQPNATRWREITIWLAAAAAVLLADAAIAITYRIGPDRIRREVIRAADENLHSRMQVGRIQFSLLGGVILRDMALTRHGEAEPYFQAAQIQCRLSPWPSLHPAITGLKFQDPRFDPTALVAARQQEPPSW